MRSLLTLPPLSKKQNKKMEKETKINQELLNEKIKICKKTIASMYHFEDKKSIANLERLNKEICLVVAEFKCQRCKKEKNLQVHHLILRKVKEYVDFFRYASQRYYWGNQIVLCNKCHAKYHSIVDKSDEDLPNNLCILKEEINRIKNKFLLRE